MPRFYFDIDDSVSIRDHTGADFADTDAVMSEAFRRAAEYGGNPANLRKSGVIVVTVRDGPDSEVLKIRLVCQVEEYKSNGAGAPSGSLPPVP